MGRCHVNPRRHFTAAATTDRLGKVIDWPCFSPGYHKGTLYTADDTRRIVDNFNRLNGQLRVKARAPDVVAKLGHDEQQRLKESLGLPAVGRVTAMRLSTPDDRDDRGRPVPPGTLVVTIENIPSWVAEQIQAGNYCDGSIEIELGYPDPDDPARPMDGPVMTAIAFLGEEQPAVKGLPAPKVTFSAQRRRTTVIFSEVTTVETREQILEALQGLGIDTSDAAIAGMTDEQLKAMVNQLTGESFASAMKAKYGAAAVMSDDKDADDMAKKEDEPELKQFMAECTKRMGAMEAAIQGMQKDKEVGMTMSAEFSAWHSGEKRRAAERAVGEAVLAGKLLKAAEKQTIDDLMRLSNLRKDCFSKGHASAGLTPFEAALQEIENRQPSKMFSDHVDDGKRAEDGGVDPWLRGVLERSPDGRAALARMAK